ncbi:hypothetical protein Taro_041658 [Colocasia esculenta]|uniref:Uncharacterized protein n=1 Tax=Colocasia esculenta TaxID=4460 RepID=A0A843X0Z1_COLES|nr:hypothetical protein [Colocasia esculenta]
MEALNKDSLFTASVLVYGLLELGEFPTEPVTSEAHPYSPQVKARRRFCYHLPVQGRVVAVLGQHPQQCSFRSSAVSFFSCTSLPRGMPQSEAFHHTSTRRSRGILEQWSVGIGVPKHREKTYTSIFKNEAI